MKPKDAIKLKGVNLAENYPPEDTLPEDGLYCYLLQPTTTNVKEQQIEYGPRKLTD